MSAVIFDCDGVLIDSEPLSVAELGRTLREAGATMTDADIYARMIGRPVAEIVAIVAEEEGWTPRRCCPPIGRGCASGSATSCAPSPASTRRWRRWTG